MGAFGHHLAGTDVRMQELELRVKIAAYGDGALEDVLGALRGIDGKQQTPDGRGGNCPARRHGDPP